MELPTNLNVKEASETTQTIREVTVTLTFSDADLENEATKAFYDMIKPQIPPSTDDLSLEDETELGGAIDLAAGLSDDFPIDEFEQV